MWLQERPLRRPKWGICDNIAARGDRPQEALNPIVAG